MQASEIIAYVADAAMYHPACKAICYGDDTTDREGNEISPVFRLNFEDWHYESGDNPFAVTWREHSCDHCLNYIGAGPRMCPDCGTVLSGLHVYTGVCTHVRDH